MNQVKKMQNDVLNKGEKQNLTSSQNLAYIQTNKHTHTHANKHTYTHTHTKAYSNNCCTHKENKGNQVEQIYQFVWLIDVLVNPGNKMYKWKQNV